MARTIGSYGPKTLEAIRKAGLRLIFEHGYAAMSLRDLAAEVGIQVGSLYNHISTKQELLFDLVQDHVNELLRQLDLALEGKIGPEQKLRAFVAFHVTYHMNRKREVFIANSELRSLEPKNYDAIVALRSAYEARLARILSEGVSEGVFEVVDIKVATFAILALLTGICSWYRPGRTPDQGGDRRRARKAGAVGRVAAGCERPCPQLPQAAAPSPASRRWPAGARSSSHDSQPTRLDDIDLKILSELQKDGRIRINELASRVGLSLPPCLRRVRSLRARGVIKAIRATIDEKVLGYEVVSFVSIQLASQAKATLEAFEASIAALPLVLQSWRISGEADFLLKCIAPDVEGMHQQLLQFAAMPEVRTIRSLPVLGIAKDAPLPIPEDPAHRSRRMPWPSA